MNRLLFRVTRACSKEIIDKKSISAVGMNIEEDKLSEAKVNVAEIEDMIGNIQYQQKIVQVSDHLKTRLNFAVEEEGKVPILQVTRSPQQPLNLFNLSIHASALLYFGYSISYTGMFSLVDMGIFAGYALFASGSAIKSSIHTIIPKIVNINKLSDGKLEIVYTHLKDYDIEKAHQTIVVDNADFEYGIKSDLYFVPGVTNLGVWCSVEKKPFLIAGEVTVNNHLFNEIL